MIAVSKPWKRRPTMTRTDAGPLLYFVLAAAAFGVFYVLDNGNIFLGGIAAASVLAIGIARALAMRSRKAPAAE